MESEAAVPFPAKIDDEYLLEDTIGVQPQGVPSLIDAFIVTINIFEIVDQAKKINPGSSSQGFRLPELAEVLRLNDKISQIENSLPPHLNRTTAWKQHVPRDQILKIQADVVMTR